MLDIYMERDEKYKDSLWQIDRLEKDSYNCKTTENSVKWLSAALPLK